MTILAIHIFCTLFMTGVIWFVQVVHYPLFSKVGVQYFKDYAKAHQTLTSYVVAPVMIAEMITLLLLVWHSQTWDWQVQLGLLLVIWISTALFQIPCHQKLLQGFEAKLYKKLVYTNWIRTLLWTIRSVTLVMIF